MKKLIACVLSILFYSMGHVVSLMMHTGFTGWLYPLYNKLMIWSGDLETWADVEVMWGKEVRY